MSRPSFIGILLLTVGLAILAGLALWHHQWLMDLESQLTRHRLQLKVLTSKEPPPAADATAVPTLPEVKPAPSGAERLSENVPRRHPAIQHENVLTSKEPPPSADVTAVPTLPEVKPAPSGAERLSENVPARHPAIQHEAALALPARRPVIEPVDEFAGMDNRAIDKECDRRGLLTDTLPERWRCSNGKTK